jgi:hypothetical protein
MAAGQSTMLVNTINRKQMSGHDTPMPTNMYEAAQATA